MTGQILFFFEIAVSLDPMQIVVHRYQCQHEDAEDHHPHCEMLKLAHRRGGRVLFLAYRYYPIQVGELLLQAGSGVPDQIGDLSEAAPWSSRFGCPAREPIASFTKSNSWDRSLANTSAFGALTTNPSPLISAACAPLPIEFSRKRASRSEMLTAALKTPFVAPVAASVTGAPILM